ncbi:MAG: hypothetical protein BalsKO_08910 [Balneolaceae bacterium]
MKIAVLALFISFILHSENILLAQEKEKSQPIEVGQIFSIDSKVLDEERQIYISLPAGYDTLSTKLPVIYVLDAEYRFGIAQSIQSYFNITTRIPQAILVGIANPSREARERNYLPTSYGGEAHNFTDFLIQELFPFIEGKYSTTQKRYLAGHSHGGVFVLYTLLNNSDYFEGYIAIDPSLKYIYSEEDTLLDQDFGNKRLYLASSDVAYGYLEDIAADMHADFTVFKNHLDKTKEENNLTFKIDHINDDHGNSYIQGFSRGLRYIFNWRFE